MELFLFRKLLLKIPNCLNPKLAQPYILPFNLWPITLFILSDGVQFHKMELIPEALKYNLLKINNLNCKNILVVVLK